MQARGPLMMEHRLIERMLSSVESALARMEVAREVEPVFVDTVVDFVRVYADRTHHGKEEEILFRALSDRPLSSEDGRILKELLAEHAFGRQTTRGLVEANARYRSGNAAALADVANNLRTLVAFYPEHIQKEDKVFFPASRAYFTDEEDRALLAEFWEFDRKMIHEKYKAVVDGL